MTIIYITEKPTKPLHGDYDILIGYGVDDNKNCYELVFTDDEGKAGKLESVMNVFDRVHTDPADVELKIFKEVFNNEEKEIHFLAKRSNSKRT